MPRAALVQGLKAGRNLADIGREYGADRSIVGRAVRALSVEDLSSLVIGKAQTDSMPEVPAPDLQAPIDVMGEIMGVMDDIRQLRAWLSSPEAGVELRTPQRLGLVISLLDRRLEWADSFVRNASVS